MSRIINVAQEIGVPTSRENGQKLRAAIETALGHGEKVRIDFHGAHPVNHAFVKEAFRPLALKYGGRFFESIELVNCGGVSLRVIKDVVSSI